MALPRLFRTYNSRQRGTLRAAGSYRCHWQHLNDTVLCACLEKGEESRKTFRVPAECQDSTKFYMGAFSTPSSVICRLFGQKRYQQHCYSPFRVPLIEKGTPFTYFHKPPRIPPLPPHMQQWKSVTDAAWAIGIRNEVAITFTAVCTHLVHAPTVDTHPCHGAFIDIW